MTLHSRSALVLAAVGCLASAAPLQETSKQVTTVAEPQTGVRLELSGPQQPTYVWAASEWTLKFDNRSTEDLPCTLDVLEPAGRGGARVSFEIAKDGKTVRSFSSRSFDLSSNCGGVGKSEVIAPGASAELPVVLHGEMHFDLEAYARDEEVYTRFEPAFETPGAYTVTAVLRWKASTIRSNSIALDVGDAPAGCKRAREELAELAKAGLCIDVQGMYTNQPWAKLERIADFVEREKHTLYGAQLQIGLAQALFWILQADSGCDVSRLRPPGVTVTLERVKSLLTPMPPFDVGLDRTFGLLREAVAKQERESR